MNIIHARLNDLDLLVPLFDQYRQFYEQPSDPVGARNFLAERLRNKESVILLALEEDQSPAGFVQLYPSWTSVSMKRLWILNDLFVSPSYRRKGVAQSLIKKAIEVAKETRCKGLTLETLRQNVPVQKLIEKLGWKREEQFFVYYLDL